MRGELDLGGGEGKLLEQLAGVAMAEDGVGGEVVGRIHEVGLVGGFFAGSADAAFRVADDAVIEIDDAGAEEWGEREDDGRGVTAGVGDQAGRGDPLAMELGRAEDGFGLKLGGEGRVGVDELVDGAVGCVVEAPGTAEVDDADASRKPLGNPLARGLMRQREKDDIDAGGFDELPAESVDRGEGLAAPKGELGVKLLERDGAGLVGDAAEEERRGVLEARVG